MKMYIGPAVLLSAFGLALLITQVSAPPPFDATAQAAAQTDDDTVTLPDHVSGTALEARCNQLWAIFDTQGDIVKRESAKPGFTSAYRAATHLGEQTALQIESQGCPVKDRATFHAQVQTLHLLNQMGGV
jgi:hypothetical protein